MPVAEKPGSPFAFEGLGLTTPEEEAKAIKRYEKFREEAHRRLAGFQRQMDATKQRDLEKEARFKKRLLTLDAVLRCLAERKYLTADPATAPSLQKPGYLVFNDACFRNGKIVRLMCPVNLAENPDLKVVHEWLEARRKER